MLLMRTVWVFDAYALSVPFVGASEAGNDSSKPAEIFYKMFYLLKLLVELYYLADANYLINLSRLYESTLADKTYKK